MNFHMTRSVNLIKHQQTFHIFRLSSIHSMTHISSAQAATFSKTFAKLTLCITIPSSLLFRFFIQRVLSSGAGYNHIDHIASHRAGVFPSQPQTSSMSTINFHSSFPWYFDSNYLSYQSPHLYIIQPGAFPFLTGLGARTCINRHHYLEGRAPLVHFYSHAAEKGRSIGCG